MCTAPSLLKRELIEEAYIEWLAENQADEAAAARLRRPRSAAVWGRRRVSPPPGAEAAWVRAMFPERPAPTLAGSVRRVALWALIVLLPLLLYRLFVNDSPSSGDQMDVALHMTKIVKPRYPDPLKNLEVQGTVVLQSLVAADGKVERASVKVIRHLNPLLDAAAVQALSVSEFSPARYDGRAVPAMVQIPYTYRFSSRKDGPGDGVLPGTGMRVKPRSMLWESDSAAHAALPFVRLVRLWRRRPPDALDRAFALAFSPEDTLFARLEIEGARTGDSVFARWIDRSADGGRIIRESRSLIQTVGDARIDVFAAQAAPWPEGDYELRAGAGDKTHVTAGFRVERGSTPRR